MKKKCKRPSIEVGTCQNCFTLEIAPGTKICPVCNTANPYTSVEDAVYVLLHSGYGFLAVGCLVKFKGWTVKKAIKYCMKIYTGLELGIVGLTNDLNDLFRQMIKDGHRIKLIKLVKVLSFPLFRWDLIMASDFVDTLFCPKRK
jgi:hypothetical protein